MGFCRLKRGLLRGWVLRLGCCAVGEFQKCCDYNFLAIGSFDWVNFFKHADCVVTNTFHGTIFSVLMGKRFCVLPLRQKSNKVGCLLKDLTLTGQMASGSRTITSLLNEDVDYTEPRKRLESMREESRRFLEEALV